MSPRQRRVDGEACTDDPGDTGDLGDPTDPSDSADPSAVAGALRAWADARRREQLRHALEELDACDEVSERERAALADLSRSLVASLLDPPLRALEGDDRAAAVAADLFDLDGE